MTREKIQLLQEELIGLQLIKIRELRNLIAHEYATEEMPAVYAAVAALSPSLLAAVPKVINYAEKISQRFPDGTCGFCPDGSY